MSVTEARDRDLIEEGSDETLKAFSYSEMKLYKHAIEYKCRVGELIATIKLIKSTDLKVEDVDVDPHKRVAAALVKGHFSSHNMQESDLDCYRSRAADSVLPEWERSQYHPVQVQRRCPSGCLISDILRY